MSKYQESRNFNHCSQFVDFLSEGSRIFKDGHEYVVAKNQKTELPRKFWQKRKCEYHVVLQEVYSYPFALAYFGSGGCWSDPQDNYELKKKNSALSRRVQSLEDQLNVARETNDKIEDYYQKVLAFISEYAVKSLDDQYEKHCRFSKSCVNPCAIARIVPLKDIIDMCNKGMKGDFNDINVG